MTSAVAPIDGKASATLTNRGALALGALGVVPRFAPRTAYPAPRST